MFINFISATGGYVLYSNSSKIDIHIKYMEFFRFIT